MTKYILDHLWDSLIFLGFIGFIAISYSFNFLLGQHTAQNFGKFAIEMISFVPAMFILIGLFDVWFPKEKVEKHIGADSGFIGTFWVILLAMLQAGPLYGAFPVTYLLWKKGSSIRNIFIYLGAFATMKIPMLTFEITFLGLKFSIIRTLLTLPCFIVIGWLMEWIFKNKGFEVKQPQ
jgi:uncharacterized membrane protein YraQ (UPF0718 family)